MHQLKNLPPMSTVEPKLSHNFNACRLYGSGDVPKLMSKDIDIHSGGPLEGKFGKCTISSKGDYYSIMPFGLEPPVPYIPPANCSQRGFYQQEFQPARRPEVPRLNGYVSPDMFYSSSLEPDKDPTKKVKRPKNIKNKVEKKINADEPNDIKTE